MTEWRLPWSVPFAVIWSVGEKQQHRGLILQVRGDILEPLVWGSVRGFLTSPTPETLRGPKGRELLFREKDSAKPLWSPLKVLC